MIKYLPTLITVARRDDDGLYVIESWMEDGRGTSMQPAKLSGVTTDVLADRLEVLVYGEAGLVAEMRAITGTPEPKIVATIEVQQTDAMALEAPVWALQVQVFGRGRTWFMQQYIASTETEAVGVARGWLMVFRRSHGMPGAIPMATNEAAAA
jgi:hypothetical protein